MERIFGNDVEKLKYHLGILLDMETDRSAEDTNVHRVRRILEMMEMCGNCTETDDVDEFAKRFHDKYHVNVSVCRHKKNVYAWRFLKIAACLLLCVVLFFGTEFVAVNAFDVSIVQLMREWGDSIQKYVGEFDAHDNAMEESLKQAKDGRIILPQIEIDMAKDFYIISGYEEQEAERLAVQHAKEINALYQEAIANGYTASEKEIREYLEELKRQFQIADNKEEIRIFMDRFESEQAYWDFQFEVYKKDLPIQKYNAASEREFIEEQNAGGEQDGLEIQDRWVEEFERRKAKMVEKYEFVVE